MTNQKEKVGAISESIINLLELDIDVDAPIYLGDSNITHMKSSHPDDYAKYGSDIPLIIQNPDYVGINTSDDSIEYVKEYIIESDNENKENEYVKVAVRVSRSNTLYARSLYVLNNNRVKNFIAKNTLKRLDK